MCNLSEHIESLTIFCVIEPIEHFSEENKRFPTWLRNIPDNKSLILVIDKERIRQSFCEEVLQE